MKTKNKLLINVLGLLVVVFCIVVLTACGGNKNCTHQWGKWSTIKDATCTEAGTQERKCSECGEKETNTIDALGHDWNAATCSTPKTCKVCSATEGTASAHTYIVETIKDEALKSAATCTSVAVYYKSCSCGAISTNDADTFTSGSVLEHIDEDKDHVCDYGCNKTFGICEDANFDHACDYGCNKTFGICEDANFDHACDYGCNKILGVCEDANKDHECDHGCGKTFGEHFDLDTDNDHVCDYGCGAILEECFDKENDGDHNCDVCGNADITPCTFGSATCGTPATCFECGATTGSTLEHKDENHDHICDNGCNKNDIGNHFDSNTDGDHVCDYGCGAILENCFDVENDDDHACDVCGKENVTAHAYIENIALATEAACDMAATKTYECNCGNAYTENNGDALGHDITGVEAEERLINGCEYVLVYVCKRNNCGGEVLGETVYHHNYVARISTPATCSTTGEKTFKCSACGDTSKAPEVIPADATGHNWDTTGEVIDGIRTDTCTICFETKMVTVYNGTTTDSVNAGDLANKEIELNDTNISLDSGVIDTIGNQNVIVSAEKFEGDDRTDLGLSHDQLTQVGDNPIYNFTINNGTENISNFGEDNYVTITLPYVLGEGEDVDSIAVWFINDRGELESIKATYNNGYVTFKTNHFSYYTVTRLTPAERCALYGHGYAEQVVEGSCTKDGYVLLVCVRCHDKQIKEGTFVEADGHEYTSETHAATCTENGYVLYACNDCDYSYRTNINATGHAWSVIDTKEVSCTLDGFIKYGCDNCDEEYTEIHVKAGHIYTNTVVPATCTANGYTVHDCDNCDYSYTDSYVEALGHNYKAGEWIWEANGNKATLTFVCEHDDTHITALHAISTMEKVVDKSECSNYVIRTHTVTVEFNGVEYTDVMIIRQGNPTHRFSSDWTKNEYEHWHECVCGEKTDVTKHSFENATITKNPTCAEDGESISYCSVCGEAKVNVIPATGDHNYVNGFCDTCGKEEVDCDHTNLHNESIDLGELGACDWVLQYQTCDCGEIKIIDLENTHILCDMEGNYEENTYVDENGNTVMTMKGACHCGMEVSAIAVVTIDGCIKTYNYNYTLKFKGEVIITMSYAESDTSHTEEKFEINLAEHNGCEGVILGTRCAVCGKISSIHDMKVNCDIKGDVTPEEIVGEDGITRYVATQTCSKCGLKFVVEMWEVQESVCVTHQYQAGYIYDGENCIFEFTYVDTNENHNYEYSYELQGETCEEGYRVNRYCTICHENENWRSFGHREEKFEMNLAEHNGCEGVILGMRCAVCGKISSIHDMKVNCDIKGDVTPEEIVGEDGITRYVATQTCSKCGLKLVIEMWEVQESVCVTRQYQAGYIYDGENCFFEFTYVDTNENHNYEYSYELQGETCEEGYYVTRYCPICEETERNQGYGHQEEYRKIELVELGLCEGWIEERYCSICNTVLNSNISDHCNWRLVEETSDGYKVYECQDCTAMKRVYAHETEKDDNCMYHRTEIISYIVKGEEVYRYENTYLNFAHKYLRDYILNGSSCEDGYTIIYTCEDCDYYQEEMGNFHNTFVIFEMTADEGHNECCKNHYIRVHSCPCGQEFSIEFESNSFRFDEELKMYVCDNCNLTILYDTNEVEEGCTLIVTTNFVVHYGDEELYSVAKEKTYSNHNFINIEVSVVDGVTYITTSCENCGTINNNEILSVEMEQHNDRYYYDYTFNPDESEMYTIMGLAEGDTFVELYKVVDGELIKINSNDDGGYETQFLLSANLTVGTTYVYRIGYLGFDKTGTINFALTKGVQRENVCQHKFYKEFSVLLDNSKTCEDGVLYGRICTKCGFIECVRVEYKHRIIVKDRVDLSQKGACYGQFIYSSCGCGKEHQMDLYDTCANMLTNNEYYDEEGRLIHVDVRTCSECGLHYTRSYYTVKDHVVCTLSYYYTVVINVGDNLVTEMEYTTVVADHDFEIIGTLMNGVGSSCEDGVVITYKCKDCKYEESKEIYNHETFEKEHIDLSNLGSVCGGYATFYECACGEQGSLSLDHSLCEWGSEWCELWIEDAITKDQYQINGWNIFRYDAHLYICAVTDPKDAACAYKIKYARYWLKDDNSCMAYQYETWLFGYNEETGTYQHELTFKTGNNHVYHNYIDGSTDKHTKYDCSDCGSYYYENWYYDDNDNCIKHEQKASNTLSNGQIKYYEFIQEYTINVDGHSYTSHEYEKRINNDDTEYWNETFRNEQTYTGTFGNPGYKVTCSYSNSSAESYEEEYAYVWYKGYEYRIYTYRTEGDYWFKYDYSYTFENGCRRTTIYLNSNGDSREETEDWCMFDRYVTIKESTCTQDGLQCLECVICGKQTEQHSVEPHDHNWVAVADNWYYCFACGLENANGVSGDIIMEDLTETYGNGEYYVVGYYARNNVEFSKYVSLILADGTEVAIWSGIEFITIDDVRAYKFSKASVEAWATENGYTDYDVRFSFVPEGSDGSFDYAVTFAEPTVVTDTIVNNVSFTDYIAEGEIKSYTITPIEDGVWIFTSFADGDTAARLFDAEGNELAYNDDGKDCGRNFKITYELKAGETYNINVWWFNSNNVGNISLLFGTAPVIATK